MEGRTLNKNNHIIFYSWILPIMEGRTLKKNNHIIFKGLYSWILPSGKTPLKEGSWSIRASKSIKQGRSVSITVGPGFILMGCSMIWWFQMFRTELTNNKSVIGKSKIVENKKIYWNNQTLNQQNGVWD